MTAYVIVDINVTDPVRYEDYKKLAAPTVELYGGKYIARGGRTEVLEGDWSPSRLVILQFDTMEQAKSLITSLQIVVRSNDDNIHETIENLRVATGNLDQMTDQVKQRPWSLMRIRQPKDRKVPQ